MVTTTTAINTPAPQDRLSPFETLYDTSEGRRVPLPAELEGIYGSLRFPAPHDRPYVIGNLVTSLDGVVSLGIPGRAGGKEISGSNEHDRALMGLLRAVADAVIVGAGTLREGKGDALTVANVYPPLAGAYAALRADLGKVGEPLSVIVTASGDLDPAMQVFKDGQALVVTTHEGAVRLREQGLPAEVEVVEAESQDGRSIPAGVILHAVAQARTCEIVLVEGGPHLLGDFFAESLIDEQFLTLSPQVVGRDPSGARLGLVEGQTFAPDSPRWGRLTVVKRVGSHLFLRYIFDDTTASAAASDEYQEPTSR
ncbi:MAG TPA: dihydrofolate reductase family protein [Chloroflexia bacterium]